MHAILATANRAADLAEQGWVDYVGAGPRRYAGLANAVCLVRSIPSSLRRLKGRVGDWEAWWERSGSLHNDPDGLWIGQLRNSFDRAGTASGVPEVHLDAVFSSELDWRAPRGTVSTFVGDELGRTGWKVRMPDGTIETVFFTIPIPLARAYASLTVAADGRHLDAVFPRYLHAMRELVCSATTTFDVRV